MAIQQIQHGHGATIYPSDTESISDYLQVYGRSTCLYIGTGGNLRVLTVGGDDVTFRNVQSGQFLPVMVTKVFFTGTTASNITVVDMGPGRFRGLLFDYSKRVSFDGGVVEAGACVDAVNNLLLNASLLLIPSGYKGGKLYSEIPTNGNGDLTWTRGSDAFRTNASGLIQRVPWNLVRYSEEFDNASWLKLGGSSVTANTTTAPNGTLTADTLSLTTNASSSVAQSIAFATTTTITVSVYAKVASGTKDFRLRTDNPTTTQSFTATTSWQRFSMTVTPTGNTSAYVINDLAGTAGDLFIWGFQVVEGTTAQTYLPTTDRLNFPRLDYTYGSCPSALLEPQRTNLALYSEQFNDASWTKVASSITANTTTSPDGSTNADTLAGDGSLGFHFIQQSQSVVSGTSYSISVYAKKNTNNIVQLFGASATFGTNVWANFDLNNGVVGSVGSSTTASIQNVGNGWYRCVIVAVATSTGNNPASSFGLVTSSTSVRAESNTLSTSVFLYGAQLEAGAYPTTYIPTTSATATRVADSFSRSNIYTNGLISASGGTWFVSLVNNIVYTRDTFTLGLYISDTTNISSNNINIRTGGTARLAINKVIAGISTALYLTTTDTTKLAIKWNGTTADIFANGTKVVSATAFTPTNMEFLRGDTTQVPVFIQQMALFPTPLSDTDCQLLTAL